MPLVQRMHFLRDEFQMTRIALLSVINHYHIMDCIYSNILSDENYQASSQKFKQIAYLFFYRYNYLWS